MRGRRPKPAELKRLEGNRGKRLRTKALVKSSDQGIGAGAFGNSSLPRHPSADGPACPQHVRGEARREWKRTSAALLHLNLLTEIDRAALAAYCIAYGRWAEAEEKVRELGVLCAPPSRPDAPLFGSEQKKEVHPAELVWNPWLAVANKAMDRMMRYLVEFGMTPSSRARVHAAPEDHDESEDFFFRDAEPRERKAVQ